VEFFFFQEIDSVEVKGRQAELKRIEALKYPGPRKAGQ
jgi:hypothetical protein